MSREELEQFIKIYKIDLDDILDENCSQRHHDVIVYNILYEGIAELIKFTEKVNKILDVNLEYASGEYQKGYKDAFDDIKRIIYEKK